MSAKLGPLPSATPLWHGVEEPDKMCPVFQEWSDKQGPIPEITGQVCFDELPDNDLPGMWTGSDFLGGSSDEFRGPSWTPDSNSGGVLTKYPSTLQEWALENLALLGARGLTAKEFGDIRAIPHQSYSSVMSKLQRTGKVVRLLEQRKGAEVYVLPEYVNDRPVSEFRPNVAARKIASLLALVDKAEAEGATAIYVTALRKALS